SARPVPRAGAASVGRSATSGGAEVSGGGTGSARMPEAATIVPIMMVSTIRSPSSRLRIGPIVDPRVARVQSKVAKYDRCNTRKIRCTRANHYWNEERISRVELRGRWRYRRGSHESALGKERCARRHR